MCLRLITSVLILFSTTILSQDHNEEYHSYSSLDLGYANSGLSFGNSKTWNGIRFNVIDDGIEDINGINFTLWRPEEISGSEVNGFAIGAVPSAGRLNGISIGSWSCC